jgi:endonuclease I
MKQNHIGRKICVFILIIFITGLYLYFIYPFPFDLLQDLTSTDTTLVSSNSSTAIVYQSVDMYSKVSSNATSLQLGEENDNASLLNLNPSDFFVNYDKGDSKATKPGLYEDSIRLYSHSSGNNNTISVEYLNGTIAYIEVYLINKSSTCQSCSTNIKVSSLNQDNIAVEDNNVYYINSSEFSINNARTVLDDNLQVRISKVSIYYYPSDITNPIVTIPDNISAYEGSGESIDPSVDTSTDLSTYYAPIYNKQGNELVSSLITLISDMTPVSYGDSRFALEKIDEDINNPGYFYTLYDTTENIRIPNTWGNGGHITIDEDTSIGVNREHVWPCNNMRLKEGAYRPDNTSKGHYSDLHNLRISQETTNKSHSDHYFGENLSSSNPYDPKPLHRGDVARILFYMDYRYDGDNGDGYVPGASLYLSDTIAEGGLSMGLVSQLVKWHLEDPVSEFEIARNNKIYYGVTASNGKTYKQGNRNPFIDHPELVCSLYKCEA